MEPNSNFSPTEESSPAPAPPLPPWKKGDRCPNCGGFNSRFINSVVEATTDSCILCGQKRKGDSDIDLVIQLRVRDLWNLSTMLKAHCDNLGNRSNSFCAIYGSIREQVNSIGALLDNMHLERTSEDYYREEDDDEGIAVE